VPAPPGFLRPPTGGTVNSEPKKTGARWHTATLAGPQATRLNKKAAAPTARTGTSDIEQEFDGRRRCNPWTRATTSYGRHAGGCPPISSPTENANGTGGGKTGRTAPPAAGSWSFSALGRTGDAAPTPSPCGQACSPSGGKDAGSTSRKKDAATRRPAAPAAISGTRSRAPSGPRTARSTSGPSGSMVMIISDRAAASQQEAAGIAPASFKSATGPGRMSYTTSGKPP
jgi:hypothetical protein